MKGRQGSFAFEDEDLPFWEPGQRGQAPLHGGESVQRGLTPLYVVPVAIVVAVVVAIAVVAGSHREHAPATQPPPAPTVELVQTHWDPPPLDP